jgi:hypothetical protein
MPQPAAHLLCPDTPLGGAEMAPPLLATVSEAARQQAIARFQIIPPWVERGIPLSEVARRWGQRYRAGGLVTLAATQGTPAPCSRTVYHISRRIAPALRT